MGLKKESAYYGGPGLVEEIGGERATSEAADEPHTIGASHCFWVCIGGFEFLGIRVWDLGVREAIIV